MLVIKIELWPFGSEHNKREIGRMYVANDGTGDRDTGHYKAAVCRRGSTALPKTWGFEKGAKPVREGVVSNYPRKAYNVWRLIMRALKDCFPEENRGRERDELGDLEVAGRQGSDDRMDADGGP